MSSALKNQKNILEKLKIENLNAMQKEANVAIHSHANVILLSPTGTGKTLAFLLPTIAGLNPNEPEIQMLILVPSRELAIQIEQVIREMGTGFKVNAIYGGRAGAKDKIDLKHRPAILIGTPGRVADHFRRESFATHTIQTLVLDEFDKSLEVGFEAEMKEILSMLNNVRKRVLTSATQGLEIPDFVRLHNAKKIDFLHEGTSQLRVQTVVSPSKDKLETLVDLLCHLGNQPGIVFCNFKETIQRVSDYLKMKGIAHGCFYGGMEQKDRERALIKFRNGTHQLLVATDLAARGIDVPEIKFIIHYQLPPHAEEFTHRNGRTARMFNDGTAYILQWEQERLPDFVKPDGTETLQLAGIPSGPQWKTLFVSGGRKDKISKSDLAGFFFKQAHLTKDELGVMELKQDCAFVAVLGSKVDDVISKTDNSKLKNKKIRVSEV